VPLWLVALLSAALRGAGEVKVPALVTLAGAIVVIPTSPALIFGWGALPRLGIAGAATAVVAYNIIAVLALIAFMRSAASPLRLTVVRLKLSLLRDVLGVGLLSALGTVQLNLTVTCITGIVGLLGPSAIAGYGIASRLDYLQIPLLFGLGTAVVTMVGINVGAGQRARALRIAWVGAVIAAGFTELLGVLTAAFPRVWLSLFTDEPDVLATGALYLRTVAPVYGFVGLGMMLYFASQGAKRVLWPVLAGTVRMIVAGLIGWFAVVVLGADLFGLFLTIAVAAIFFGTITAAAIFARAWDRQGAAYSGEIASERAAAR